LLFAQKEQEMIPAAISCHHDLWLVAVSILISIMAAFAARELLARINETAGRRWLLWLAGTSIVDGIGTWSMHYTGELACHLPVPLLFDWRIVLLSLLVGITGSAATLLVLARRKFSWGRALIASILLGGWGISGLHYVAMAALLQPAAQYHFSPLVVTAIVIAMAISFGAIVLAYRSADPETEPPLRKHASSILRGMANPAMHYAAMAGVTFGSLETANLSYSVGIGALGILGICVVPAMVIVVGLLVSVVDRLNKQTTMIRSFSRRVEEAHEIERRHLARELHDQIGQALTAAKINTDIVRSNASPDLVPRLDETATILDRLLQETRQISLDLRPPLLDDLGLVAALRWYVDQQAARAGLLAKFSADPWADEVPPHVQTACFRLAQEAITNALRHARATTLKVELRRAHASLRLLVQDDGVGFDVSPTAKRAERGASFGLVGMKERAALAGGRTRIVSYSGRGTTVDIHLPLHGAEERASLVPGISPAAFSQ
jgi:signal transduction histidine kinase